MLKGRKSPNRSSQWFSGLAKYAYPCIVPILVFRVSRPLAHVETEIKMKNVSSSAGENANLGAHRSSRLFTSRNMTSMNRQFQNRDTTVGSSMARRCRSAMKNALTGATNSAISTTRNVTPRLR